MGLDWKGLAGPPRKAGRRGRSPKRIAAAGVVLVTAGAALWLLLSRNNAAGEPEDPGDADVSLSMAPPTNVQPPRPRISIDLYPGEARLAGVEMLEGGELEDAERWLCTFLGTPDPEGREDQALYALGMLNRDLGRVAEAEEFFRRLANQRQDSLRAGDGLYELGHLLEDAGRPAEADECRSQAVKFYSSSRGGMKAALALADALYEEHVVGAARRSEWERIRDLYSDALPCLEGAERGRVIERLDKLNEWVIFTAYARPKDGYVSNIRFHPVKPGETLGHIAKHYSVTVGALRRLNGIPPDSNVIRTGDEIKVLRGRCAVLVDLSERRLTTCLGGKFFREYMVGIGREGRTPVGTFRVATRVPEPPWYSPAGDVIPYGDPGNILGTRWLGFERKGAGRGIGIHGSVAKDGVWQGIGKAESNGCIRMRDPDVEELFDFAPIGTEVTIME